MHTTHLANRSERSHRYRGESGAELIELALVFPMLLMVGLGIVDFGLLFQRLEVLTNGAREGVRIAAVQGTTQAEIENRVSTYIQSAGGVPTTASNPAIVVTTGAVSTASGSWPTRIVSVSYVHDYVFLPYVTGWFGGTFSQTTLQAQATMRMLTPGAGP